MNFASSCVQRENQKRLFEAFCRISEDNVRAQDVAAASHLMPDHLAFFAEAGLMTSPELGSSSASNNNCVEPHDFSLGLNENHATTFAYDPVATAPHQSPLHVDHRGTKVDEPSSSSSWIPISTLSDMSYTSSTPDSTPINQGLQPEPTRATVFAAAVTAAMIMDRSDSVPKRPRSPVAKEATFESHGINDVENYNSYNGDDDATEASSDESEVALDASSAIMQVSKSPRTVKDFPRFHTIKALGSKGCNLATASPDVPFTTDDPTDLIEKPIVTVRASLTPPNQNSNYEPAPTQTPMQVNSQKSMMLSKKRRAEAMERFRRKKAVRCYGRKVRYQIRKRIATTRPRVNGRFARRSDADMQASGVKE